MSVLSAQLLTFAQTGEPDAWASALARLTVVQAIETLEPGVVDATLNEIEELMLPRALRSLERLADMGVLERSSTNTFSVPELLRSPFAGGIALALAFLNEEPELDDEDVDDRDPFSDPAVRAEMARLGIVHTPGMAAEMMRELAPLLAEEGIDLHDLETDVDLDAVNTALARATQRRNLELFTPVGEMRAMALTVHRLVTEALAEGSADLARVLIDGIQPDPVGSLPSVAHVIGVGLGLLDPWQRDATLGSAVARAQPPAWEADAMRAARDILRAAREARAFDQLENLHRRYGGHAILEGTLLAVAGTVIARPLSREPGCARSPAGQYRSCARGGSREARGGCLCGGLPVMEDEMANYSRWDDVKQRRAMVSDELRAAIDQDLDLGQLVYDLRTAAGLSQRELAARMKTTQSVISRLEEGGGAKNRIDTLARLATALGRHLVLSFPEEPSARTADSVQVA